MAEWALVIFTVLSQMAAGALVTLWLLDRLTGKVTVAIGTVIARGIVVAMGISLIASLGHLGDPLGAYRAITHLGSSWLSREVVLFGLFFFLTLVYEWQWRQNRPRDGIGLLAALVAILAVISSGLVYTLPARPAWNNAGPVFFFLFTAATLGPLFVALLARGQGELLGKTLFRFILATMTCSLLCFGLYITVLLGSEAVPAQTASNIITNVAWWPRLLAGWLIPLGLLAYSSWNKAGDSRQYVSVLFMLVLIGEVLGRELFYHSVVALTMFGR